jgi:hypothetical protein
MPWLFLSLCSLIKIETEQLKQHVVEGWSDQVVDKKMVKYTLNTLFSKFPLVFRGVDSYLPRFTSSHGQNFVDSRGAAVHERSHNTVVWTLIYHRQSTNQKAKFSTVVVKMYIPHE